ncbi:helix-turn-helix transcriptional regulator [Pseudomonas sp. NPDC090202]|uniref:helix-turn-helix transcriptional regulator n=1 Tax=unclassified Pseudomonas TaxID=196821 RepID=UPI0037F4AE5A
MFLSDYGELSFSGAGGNGTSNIEYGSSFILRGGDQAIRVAWAEPNDFVEITLADDFFAEVCATLPIKRQPSRDLLCRFGAEADFALLATRLAQRLESEGDGIFNHPLHCPATARFIVAMMLRDKRADGMPTRQLSDLRYSKVALHIERRLALPIPVGELADIASQSPYHFTRTFKARTGQSPHAYILERRLRRAEYLLAETRTRLTQISQECGFSSQSHFNATFKRHVGMTPGQYRELGV